MVNCEICVSYHKQREISQLYNDKWLTVRFVFLNINREKFFIIAVNENG